MKRRTMWIGALAAVAVIGATGATFAAQGDDAEGALTGDTLRQASEAALTHTGGGTVTETERSGDSGGTYEVEVTLENGQQVDVELDADFKVVGQSSDDDSGSGESGESGNDQDG